jgi:hypothetical protein
MLQIRIRDPVLFFTPGSGWVKNQDPGSGSRMKIPDNISESLETIFRVKNTLILGCGSGSRIRNLFDPGSEIRNGKFGSGIQEPG